MIQEESLELKPIKRGTANPYVGLEQSIFLVDQLKKAVGRGPFSKDVAAQGLNHQSASGPALGKIAALVHFGLLSRNKNAYSITNLADRILLPVSDEDKAIAIIEAAKKPKLYRQLVEKYQNQALPILLNNILVRDYGINEKRSKNVAKDFIKSLEFAGILDNGVVLINELKRDFESKQHEQEFSTRSKLNKDSVDQSISFSVENSKHEYSLQPGRKVFISYPQDFSLEEAKSIKSFGEYLISMRHEDVS